MQQIKPSVVLVINDLTPEFLSRIGPLLKDTNITLVKRVPLSEQGPIGSVTEARLDLSAANDILGIPASQKIVHGFNRTALELAAQGPIDAIIQGRENESPTLLIKNHHAPSLEKLKNHMSTLKSQSHYKHLFAEVHTDRNQEPEVTSQLSSRFRI